MTVPMITADAAQQLAFDAYANPRVAAAAAPLQLRVDSLTGQLTASQALAGQEGTDLDTAKQALAALQTQFANTVTADKATIAAEQQQIAALQAQLNGAQPGKAPAPPAGYTVALQDDFNGTAAGPSWTVANNDSANNELSARMAASNVTTADHLSITAHRVTPQVSGHDFVSGYITTAGHQSIPYGKWLVRARWTDLFGLWPALWLRFDNALGEIDIMEAIGTWPQLAFNAHQNTSGTQDKTGTAWPWPTGWTPQDWHVYGLERQKDGTLIWTVDNTVVKTAAPTGLDNQKQSLSWLTGPTYAGPAHLIINLQVGGSMPKSILGSAYDPAKILPAGTTGSFDIDWVQVLTPIAS